MQSIINGSSGTVNIGNNAQSGNWGNSITYLNNPLNSFLTTTDVPASTYYCATNLVGN